MGETANTMGSEFVQTPRALRAAFRLRLCARWLLFVAIASLLAPGTVVFATVFPLPQGSSGPRGIVTGPDGALWFTQQANKIGRITTSGSLTEYSIPTDQSSPDSITLGPDENLWFLETRGNKVARITPAGAVTEFSVPTASAGLAGIAADASNARIWFTEFAANKVGFIDVHAPNTVQEVPLSVANCKPYFIAIVAGSAWVTCNGANKVLALPLNPPFVVTEYAVPAPATGPTGITAAPDGKIWFLTANHAARLDPTLLP